MGSYVNTIPIDAPLSPRDTRHRYPTHSDEFTLGGYRSVLTLLDRDDIKDERRKNGMLVYVVEEDKTYILKSGIWEEVQVELIVKSQDNSIQLNNINTIKIDTRTGMGFSSSGNGEVTLTAQKGVETFSDSDTGKIDLANNPDVKFNETNTIKPKINGNNVEFKTKTFSYSSTSSSIQHIINHGLNTNIIIVNTFIKNDDGTMDFVVVPYTIKTLNTIEVNLTLSKNIMVNVIPL